MKLFLHYFLWYSKKDCDSPCLSYLSIVMKEIQFFVSFKLLSHIRKENTWRKNDLISKWKETMWLLTFYRKCILYINNKSINKIKRKKYIFLFPLIYAISSFECYRNNERKWFWQICKNSLYIAFEKKY